MSFASIAARATFNDLPWELAAPSVLAATRTEMAAPVTALLAGRRTVRVMYSRSCDTYSVSLVQGDRVISALAYVSVGEFSEALAETSAAAAARLYGLDITRLDIP
jgi:hypothetical protein